IGVALHQRLAHALEFDLDQAVLLVEQCLEALERQSPARWPLCQSLTWHMVQRKLQRLTFSMSSLIGR
ncbi:hypothetical protein ABTE44_19410, partial [Acinetobacter baumannii]